MVTLTDFEKKYGNKIIIRCDSLCFNSGKISFLMAPNGAGKTTLLKCITALEQYEGQIMINDKENTDNLEECLVIWDDCPFIDTLSGLKNLLILSENKKSNKEIFDIAIKHLNEELLRRRVRTYSYGQRKRLALALAEILNPTVLIMDEISNGLDFDTMQELQKKLKELSVNRTIILTGHQFGFYEKIYDDLYIIKDGVIIKENSVGRKSLEEVYCETLHIN
ncbi:MAG: ABC transporter ATP-binding protein [Lachnospiraceae bacterium]|nr:ABC transporter ATP-binding protein [Lachnospiraceae bacterium]